MRRLVSTLALCAALGTAVPAGMALAQGGPADAGKPPAAAQGPAEAHHGWRHGDRHHDRFGMRHHRRGPLQLASYLSAMETGIGIRPDQQAAWLDYTNALQAMLKRPPRPEAGKPAEAFAGPERMAALSVERDKGAEALTAAIRKLRSTLTPEQLERAKQLEAERHHRMAAAFGGRHDRPFGHHERGAKGPDRDQPRR